MLVLLRFARTIERYMPKKRLLILLTTALLTVSVSAASAQSMMWQYKDDQMRRVDTNPVSQSSYTTPTVQYYHPTSTPTAQALTSTSYSPPTESNLLRLRSLFQEHAAVGGDTLVARFDNAAHFIAAQEALNKNSSSLEQEIGNMYGSDVQSRFSTLWEDHNNQYIRYTDGLKGDTALKDDAKAQLDRIIEDLATLFDRKANVQRSELVDLFKNHVYFTRHMIDMHAAGNYRMEFEYGHVGFEHMAAIAEALSLRQW